MSPKIKLSKANFKLLDLPNPLINIWDSNDPMHVGCSICKQYKKWRIEVAKELWMPEFLDFDYVLSNLRQQNRKHFNFGKISSRDRRIIYRLIHKDRAYRLF